MLVHIKELFRAGVAESFAHPAFNTQNLETSIGIIQAAEELGVPVIVATSEGTISYAGLETLKLLSPWHIRPRRRLPCILTTERTYSD